MKWIFILLSLFSSYSFAVESIPATQSHDTANAVLATCASSATTSVSHLRSVSACDEYVKSQIVNTYIITSWGSTLAKLSDTTFRRSYNAYVPNVNVPANGTVTYGFSAPPVLAYTCTNSEYPVGPVDLNGAKVCQKKPKICLKGAIVRVTSDGKETCVPNCSSAAGLAHSGQYFFQAGPDAGSTAGQVSCYGQCSIQTIGGGVQLSSGAWTGSFTFTGANCPVVRPEPTLDSESNTSSNGDAPPVDNSNTSEGTQDAIGELSGAASSATGTQVQPNATGPNGETTLKDVAKVVADSANAQIKATSEQNVATGKLVSNISKDIQNAIHNSGHGGGGASASLQAQGNGKLDTISDKLGEISDKLDDKKEETPFVPPAASSPFWENVLPDSAFTAIKDKKDSSIQELKDLQSQFSSGLFQTDLTVSGQRPEYDIAFNGQNFSAGTFVFDLLLNSGLGAIIFLIATLTAIYIITTRSK